MINVQELTIPDVKLLTPEPHRDQRGYVAETLSEKQFADLGIPIRFVQENQSYSKQKATLRGLHFQKPPDAQAKLVRVLQGRIFDVAVDLRRSSKTFGHYVAAELSGDSLTQMFIPIGFAHGFCTLEDDTIILYKMSSFYAPKSEGGILWNDPKVAIEWPSLAKSSIVIERDQKLPCLADLLDINWAEKNNVEKIGE